MNEVAHLSDFEKVGLIEREMLKFQQIEIPVKHHFSQGVYAREIFIPKGTLVTGKIHKYQQLNIMSQGELSVLTQDGVVRVKAPLTIVSPPGTRRIAYAHEDTVWTTIHGTDETDLEKIEAHYIAKDEQEYLDFNKVLLECLGSQQQ
jgi:hypothetical protein